MSKQERGFQLPRRRFVQGLALGGVAAGLGLWRGDAFAQIAEKQVPTTSA